MYLLPRQTRTWPVVEREVKVHVSTEQRLVLAAWSGGPQLDEGGPEGDVGQEGLVGGGAGGARVGGGRLGALALLGVHRQLDTGRLALVHAASPADEHHHPAAAQRYRETPQYCTGITCSKERGWYCGYTPRCRKERTLFGVFISGHAPRGENDSQGHIKMSDFDTKY